MTLGPTDAGVRVNIGVSGAGKTHLIKSDVCDAARAGMPIVVIDPAYDWEDVPDDLEGVTLRCATVARAAKVLGEGKIRLALVTPEGETEEDVADALEEACAWAIADSDELRGVVCHEAWMAAPSSGPLSPSLKIVTRMWRHKRVAAWFDCQRISDMSRKITSLCRELRLFAATGDLDFAVIKAIGGNDLVEAVHKCAEHFDRDEFGWHVVLNASRRPPYTPVRAAA